MRFPPLLLCALLACSTTAAQAAPHRITLAPPASEVEFRAYGLGILPIDGHFSRFTGALTYDPDNHTVCQVELAAEVASLATDDPAVRDTVMGPDFMDAGKYPSLKYAGTCHDAGLTGTLDMHGVARQFELSLTWDPEQVVAEGRLTRADWGMTAMAFRGGRTVRIRVTVPLPKSTPPNGN